MDDIYNELRSFIKGDKKNDINYEIACYLMFNLKDIPNRKLEEIASDCNVSTPSVIRLCRTLGFENFSDFKQAAADYYENISNSIMVPSSPVNDVEDSQKYQQSINEWSQEIQNYHVKLLNTIDLQAVKQLAQDIHHYRFVYFFGTGVSGVVAEQIGIWLSRFGKTVVVLSSPTGTEILPDKKESSLSIVISQHGHSIRQFFSAGTFSYLNQNCAKTWLVSQLPPSQKYPFSQTLYLQGNDDLSIESHGLLFFGELLIAVYSKLFPISE